jgi:hypothetical protein
MGINSLHMRGRTAETLLHLPVRVRGIHLGWPVDVILDADGRRAIGLDVLCADETHRFLALAAAEVHVDEISVGSALTLLTDVELAFYRARGSTLRGRGLRDAVLGDDWRIEALVAEEPAPAA